MDSLWTEWTEWGLIFIVEGPADWQWLSSSVARREVNQLPSWFNLKVRKNDRAKARTTDTSKFSQKKFSRDKSPLIRRNKRYQFAKGFSSAHWTKPGFDKAFYSFFFLSFFSWDEETSVAVKSSIDKNFTVARLLKGWGNASKGVYQRDERVTVRTVEAKFHRAIIANRCVHRRRALLAFAWIKGGSRRILNLVGSSSSSAAAFDCASASVQPRTRRASAIK